MWSAEWAIQCRIRMRSVKQEPENKPPASHSSLVTGHSRNWYSRQGSHLHWRRSRRRASSGWATRAKGNPWPVSFTDSHPALPKISKKMKGLGRSS